MPPDAKEEIDRHRWTEGTKEILEEEDPSLALDRGRPG